MKNKFTLSFFAALLTAALFCTAAFGQISVVNEGIMLFDVAEKYRLGDGVAQDYRKALEFYNRAMELEEPMAFRVVGHLYFTGSGVPKDSKKAWHYYTEAKRHGAFPEQDYMEKFAAAELSSQLSAADLHLKRTEEQWLSLAEKALQDPDYSEIFACQYSMTPARLGNAAAQYAVGKYYSECADPKNKEAYDDAVVRARKWLSLSAAQGNEQAKKLLESLPPVSAPLKSDAQISVEEARGLYSLLENIKEQKSLFSEEVSAKNLFSLLDDLYAKEALVDNEQNKIKFSNVAELYVNPERELLLLVSYAYPTKELGQDECIKIANEWNKDKIFLRVCWDEDSFRTEYYMSYKGGVHSDNLNDSLSWYFDLLFSFFEYLGKYTKEH